MTQDKTVREAISQARIKASLGFAELAYYFFLSFLIQFIIVILSVYLIPLSLLLVAGSIWYGRSVFIPAYAGKEV